MVNLLTHICITRPQWVKSDMMKNTGVNNVHNPRGPLYTIRAMIASVWCVVYNKGNDCLCVSELRMIWWNTLVSNHNKLRLIVNDVHNPRVSLYTITAMIASVSVSYKDTPPDWADKDVACQVSCEVLLSHVCFLRMFDYVVAWSLKTLFPWHMCTYR